MRVLVAAVLLQVAGAKGLRRGLSTDVDVDVDDSATNVVNAGGDMGADTGMDLEQSVVSWIPIKPAGQREFFFSPQKGISVFTLPRGAVVTGAVQMRDEPGTPAAAEGNTTLAPTIVPLEKRLSCVPHCAWNCTEPVCEQNCEPVCGVPQCETRCPKLGSGAFQGCKVKCGEPNCAMFCPPEDHELCPNGTKVMGCPTTSCKTRCAEPKCALDCSNANTGCKTVCPDPLCEWKCHKPKKCPKPECRMMCEQPPQCVTGGKLMVPPPLPDGWERTGKTKRAIRENAKWLTGSWGICTTNCGQGTKTRKVTCNTGVANDCDWSKKPDSLENCQSYDGCSYVVGDWSACSSRCGPGTKTREVHCDGPRCLQEKPVSEVGCVGASETCDACKVTIWGGRDFNGWEHTFEPGEYSAAELEYRGVKCDDISSLEVIGDFCKMTAYEYGDFNVAHTGWVAKFGQGKYDVAGMEEAGAKNNDISSFKIIKLGGKVTAGAASSGLPAAGGVPSNSTGPSPEWNPQWQPKSPQWQPKNGTKSVTGLPSIPGLPKIGDMPWRSGVAVSGLSAVCAAFVAGW